MLSNSATPLRRTTRQKRPSLRALESQYVSKLENSGFVQIIRSEAEEDNNFSDEDEYLNINIEKPKLLHANELIHGEEIFKFSERKLRNSLAQKVAETCLEKTPHAVRRKTKTKVEKILEAQFEDSDSEYKLSSSESSSSDEEDDGNASVCSSSTNEEANHFRDKKSKHKATFSNTQLEPTKTQSRSKYTIKSDEYFSNAASSKIQTSNNTLDKLDTPRLPQYQLQKLLQNTKLSKEHEMSMRRLSEVNENTFKNWIYLLNENFNILLYGLGSKRNILHNFHMRYLNNSPVIVVNGFFPTLTIKNILDGIIIDLLELQENPGNVMEACDLVVKEFKSIPNTHLYIIIHNIEGETIRNSKSQNILAKLASIRNIHLIASIDHINAPLIWDHNKLSKFNYIWWDVTSFVPYTEETSFERSMMIQQTGALALSSLRNIFLSLTTNSKNIYIIIVKHQLENEKNQYYQGIAFKDLYMSCSESFIVSSDLALRAQLNEFLDHKMVKQKRSVDGTEYLIIPLGTALLQEFVDEIS